MSGYHIATTALVVLCITVALSAYGLSVIITRTMMQAPGICEQVIQ